MNFRIRLHRRRRCRRQRRPRCRGLRRCLGAFHTSAFMMGAPAINCLN